jgi:YD repeat-containing protein
MPERPAVSGNPLSFITSDGKQLWIPLTALYYDAAGALKAERWPLYTANQAAVDPFLRRLAASRDIVPGPEPTVKPAFKATAVTAGASGVSINIVVANVTPNVATPASSTADVAVTETDTYTALKPDTIVEVLGNSATTGKRAGLAFVSSSGTVALPKAGSYTFAAASAGDPAKANIAKQTGSGNAFTLQARSNDAAGALTTAEIKDVDTTAQTFTLVLGWSKAVTATAIDALAAPFAYVVTIAPPDGGYRAPANGTVGLVGGSDMFTANAAQASATVLSQ